MEVGQNPGDFYRSLDIGSTDAILNKSESFMPFAVTKDSTSVDYPEPTSDLLKESTFTTSKQKPLVFCQDPKTLEFVPIQREDSGISDSPRTTPDPVEQEILSLTNFSKDFTFESCISSPELLDDVSNKDIVIVENIEQNSDFQNKEISDKSKESGASQEQLKVVEADANRNSVWPSKLGENFEGPAQYYVDPSLSR